MSALLKAITIIMASANAEILVQIPVREPNELSQVEGFNWSTWQAPLAEIRERFEKLRTKTPLGHKIKQPKLSRRKVNRTPSS